MKAADFFRPLLVALAIPLFAGCAQSVMTNPPRSATEQLLLSTAADRAIEAIPLTEFREKRVFVDTSLFDSYDSKYVIGAVRDALSRSGALLAAEPAKSDIIVEIRSGAFSIDTSDSLLGIPKTGVPVPFAGALEIPELALYKSSRQYSIAKFALLAYATESRGYVFASGPTAGNAYNKYYKFLGLIQWTSTDIPEKKRKK